MDTRPDVSAQVAFFMRRYDLFARHLGLELLEVRPGYSRVGLTLQPYMVNGLGMPHGAVIFALADYAFAAACNSHGQTAVALNMDVHFLTSPPKLARLLAEGEEIRCGRHTGLYRIAVATVEGSIVAELHGTAFRKPTRFLEQVTNDHEID